MNTPLIAIVPSAGLGTRFDSSQRKTFAKLKGTPLFIYTLQRLHREHSIGEIIPVFRDDDTKRAFQMIKEHRLNRIKRIAPGGKERQDSVYSALKLLEEECTDSGQDAAVLIHDGVRPYIPEGMIGKLIQGIQGYDGAVPGIPVKDTIKAINGDAVVESTLDREKVRAIQTPQMFSFRALKGAYDQAIEQGYYATDDAALVEKCGGRVKVIEGSPYNIKVTTPGDLAMLECIFEREHVLF